MNNKQYKINKLEEQFAEVCSQIEEQENIMMIEQNINTNASDKKWFKAQDKIYKLEDKQGNIQDKIESLQVELEENTLPAEDYYY